jgi:hypothetical protein
VDRRVTTAVGFQTALSQMATLRFGYLAALANAGSNDQPFSGDQLSGITAGAGLALSSTLRLDYAFVPMGELEATHHMSLVWKGAP